MFDYTIDFVDFWTRTKHRIARQINLDLTHSQSHYGEVLNTFIASGDRWLDIGCGRQILPDWALPVYQQQEIVRRASVCVGVDRDSSIAQHPLLRERAYAIGERLPFRDCSFDAVTANMVVEHVEQPAEFLREICRILRPGGKLLIHTPNYYCYTIVIASFIPDAIKRRIVWLLERRCDEDVFPTYYRLNTAAKINAAVSASGLNVAELRYTGTSGLFSRLGPISWLECIPMKLMHVVAGGRFNANLIVTLERPAVAAQSTAESAAA